MDDQLMTGSVVVGVVDTAEQSLVVRDAAEEAVRRGAVLRILHAVEWPAPRGRLNRPAGGRLHKRRNT